jgi:hypothetical protein
MCLNYVDTRRITFKGAFSASSLSPACDFRAGVFRPRGLRVADDTLKGPDSLPSPAPDGALAGETQEENLLYRENGTRI